MRTTKDIDNAIDEFVKAEGSGAFVTGWVLVASVSSSEHSSTSTDGYLIEASDGLPHHTQLGLLNVAVEDKRSIGFFATLNHMMFNADDDEEYGDEDVTS